MMNQARSYNDKQLDALSRKVFYSALKTVTLRLTDTLAPTEEWLHAHAAVLEGAACGFKPDDDYEDLDIPSGLRQTTSYNDDLINEMSREVYMKCMTVIDEMYGPDRVMNLEVMHGYAALADAAACGFKDDDDA